MSTSALFSTPAASAAYQVTSLSEALAQISAPAQVFSSASLSSLSLHTSPASARPASAHSLAMRPVSDFVLLSSLHQPQYSPAVIAQASSAASTVSSSSLLSSAASAGSLFHLSMSASPFLYPQRPIASRVVSLSSPAFSSAASGSQPSSASAFTLPLSLSSPSPSAPSAFPRTDISALFSAGMRIEDSSFSLASMESSAAVSSMQPSSQAQASATSSSLFSCASSASALAEGSRFALSLSAPALSSLSSPAQMDTSTGCAPSDLSYHTLPCAPPCSPQISEQDQLFANFLAENGFTSNPSAASPNFSSAAASRPVSSFSPPGSLPSAVSSLSQAAAFPVYAPAFSSPVDPSVFATRGMLDTIETVFARFRASIPSLSSASCAACSSSFGSSAPSSSAPSEAISEGDLDRCSAEMSKIVRSAFPSLSPTKKTFIVARRNNIITLEAGIDCLTHGRYAEAITTFTRILSTTSNPFIKLEALKGRCQAFYRKAQDMENREGRKSPESYTLLTHALEDIDHFEQLIMLIARDPIFSAYEMGFLLYNKGLVHQQIGEDLRAALDSFQEASEQFKLFFKLTFTRSDLQSVQKREEAQRIMKTCLEKKELVEKISQQQDKQDEEDMYEVNNPGEPLTRRDPPSTEVDPKEEKKD